MADPESEHLRKVQELAPVSPPITGPIIRGGEQTCFAEEQIFDLQLALPRARALAHYTIGLRTSQWRPVEYGFCEGGRFLP